MKHISFYQTFPDLLEKSTCQLLEKCYENKLPTLVKVNDLELQESLNKTLWTYAQRKFIPHGSSNDPSPEKQPIYITTGDENPNHATSIVLVNIIADVSRFEKKLVVFDGDNENLSMQINNWANSLKNQDYSVDFYQQSRNGSWQRKN